MKQAYISLGGNLGQPVVTITKALQEVRCLGTDFHCSRMYETVPMSSIPQGNFVNAVCSLKTTLSAEELLRKLQAIEKDLGKVPKGKEEPRIIDLDLLFLDQEVRNSEDLTLPHPEWRKRLFVLQPLLDLTETLSILEGDTQVTINIKKLVESLTPSNIVRVVYA